MTAPEFEEPEAAALDAPLAGFSTHPFLVCFPIKSEWQVLQPVERTEHPVPEYVGAWESWHPGMVSLGGLTIPKPVLGAAAYADGEGWEVQLRYARGTAIHASQGRPLGLVETVAMRMRTERSARQVRAVYKRSSSWTWDGIWVMGPDLPPCGALLLADLMAFLEEPARDAAWFAELRARAAGKAERAKVAAKSRPKKAREDTVR